MSVRTWWYGAATLLVIAVPARGQGALSTQGFGYPPGQLGTRAQTTGGGLAEFDPQTALNPAAISGWGRAAIYLQYEPEFRRVTSAGADSRTTTSRFPLVAVATRVHERATMGLSVSTLLDRTFVTRNEAVRIVDGTPVTTIERFSSTGAINDVRLAGSYEWRKSVRLGVGLHAITGENRLIVNGQFGDTATLELQRTAISYGGTALSAGAEWRPSRLFAIAASARKGATLRARASGALLASAKVPDRFGAGIRYDGIGGASLGARLDWTGWSALGALGGDSLTAKDAWDFGAGADVSGPRVGERVIALRSGVRWRTLPFELRGAEVHELALSLGTGLPLARDRATLDLGVLRAMRSAGGSAKERAWTLSVGLTVRP